MYTNSLGDGVTVGDAAMVGVTVGVTVTVGVVVVVDAQPAAMIAMNVARMVFSMVPMI